MPNLMTLSEGYSPVEKVKPSIQGLRISFREIISGSNLFHQLRDRTQDLAIEADTIAEFHRISSDKSGG